ncbi:hypothetical protein TNCV_2887371 [Trichonephila clavipes]|nr:hypothetical protein TNCV_2887371 [Trichonephila clavipes]
MSTGAAEVQEIADLSEPMNCDSNAEIDSETPIKTVTLPIVFHCLETVKTYPMQLDVKDAAQSKRNPFEKKEVLKSFISSRDRIIEEPLKHSAVYWESGRGVQNLEGRRCPAYT